jgi:uncharacterized surface protein with fasciclin (FAS1) repeats
LRAFSTKLLLPLVFAALPLAACSGSGGNGADAEAEADAGAEAAEGKLAAVVAGNRDLERVNRLVGNAGMVDVLNGVGPYTLFAPTNAALDTLGAERADALAGEEMRPQAAALLRAHIVPGTLTRRDLQTALGSSGERPVRVRTMAGTMLTFSRDGDAILVSSEDGARARLSGEEGLASNGAVQPVDSLLRRAEPASR